MGSIFYLEALCVCVAILDAIKRVSHGGRLAVFADDINTIRSFNSLSVLPDFNWMLVSVVDAITANDVDFRVFHVPGVQDNFADLLSCCHNLERAHARILASCPFDLR